MADLSSFTNILLQWIVNPLMWLLILLGTLIGAFLILVIRKKRKLVYPTYEITEYGINKLKSGWFGKQNFLKYWDYGDEVIKTDAGDPILKFSEEDFQELDNKRGILLSLGFIVILSIVVGSFNLMYDQDYSIGLNDNSTEQKFITYMSTSEQQIKGGEVSQDQESITLKGSYGLMTDAISIVWDFLSGGFIEDVVSQMNLGESGVVIGRIVRILYFLSLVFAVLFAVFKIAL